MKNRILRSALSVALCAAMLLSQGLTAFADGEIDLAAAKSSPVQVSLEELVPGASGLEPEIENTVLPQRAARAAAPKIETYSKPDVDQNKYEWSDKSFNSSCNHYRIDLYTTKSGGSFEEIAQNLGGDFVFAMGSGFRVYKATAKENWLFKGWKTNAYCPGWGSYDEINAPNVSNIPETKWAFSLQDSVNSPYNGTNSIIQVNAIDPNGSVVVNNKLELTLRADFNPTVGVIVNGVENAEDAVSISTSYLEEMNRYEVEYGDEITITANKGYKITGVTVNGTSAEVKDDGSYTLSNVIEPHDIVVTVEKTGEEPEEPELPPIFDAVLKEIKLNIICSSDTDHNKTSDLSALDEKFLNISYNYEDSTATISLAGNLSEIIESFYKGSAEHTASTFSPENIMLKYENGEWDLTEGSEKAFTINVSCETQPVEPEEETVQLCIYRNGDITRPYDTVPLTKDDGTMYHKGEAFDLTKLDIDNHYTDSKFGFKFDGWYNDDGWNDYKAGKPDNKLGNFITINGWTNIHCMVTDYEKVQVRAVINGDKDNAQVIFDGKALHGSDLNQYLDNNKNSILEKIGSNYEVADQWYNWDWYGHPIGEDATVNGWTNVYVNCTSEEVVQLVIYRNGNTEKPYQNIVLEPALMGSTLEINFDINDYYTPEDYGAGVTHFDFDGWYNDGGWNDYKAGNPNNTLPDSITINGWTNIIGMVNDYEKIIVHTVINGDTKNAKQYYVGEALHGTSLLNFLNEHKDETMPSLEGYTTDGKWYNLDHPGQEITDQTTVNGWTNLYVNFVAEGTDPGTNPGGDEGPDNPGGGDNGNNGGNNNGGSTGGGSSVSRRDDDDDWEPLPNNNYRVTKKNDKPSQNTQIVVRDPADNSDNASSNTGSDSGKHNPETGDTTTVFAAMALAAVSLGGVVLLGRKKK